MKISELNIKPLKEAKPVVTYGISPANVNAAIEKAKSKKDGIFSFRGVLYLVRSEKIRGYAFGGEVFQALGHFTTVVGKYKDVWGGEKEAKALLSQIK
jgi:hypothetical protein